VRASSEPLLAAYAPIAAGPNGGEPWPAWGNRSQPRAVLAADGGPVPGCARRGCATRGLERVATAVAATVRRSACSASARKNGSSLADGPWANARTVKSLSPWMPAIGLPISSATRSQRRSNPSLAASGFSAVGTEHLDGLDPPGSPGPGWTASPRCGPCNRPNRKPAVCHRG
jgi:hypothetical protein